MAGVRRRDPVPLYVQVKDAILARIRAGTYPVGARLPTEAELAKEFGVGTATVKQAVNTLAMDGVLVRRAGQGTFVVGMAIPAGSVPLRSFGETMSERGIPISSRPLGSALQPAGARVAWQLDMSDDELVLHVRHLRLAAGEPCALQELYVPFDLLRGSMAEGLGEHPETWLDEQPLYRLLEERLGLMLLSADESVWAEAASSELAEFLGIPPGFPVLVAERITEATGHRRVSLTRTVYRSDRFVLKFHLEGYRPASREKGGTT